MAPIDFGDETDKLPVDCTQIVYMPEIVEWQPPRGEAASLTKDLMHMTAIAVDITDQFFAQNPPFRRAFEALSAIAAQYGRARMVAWARAAEDDPTRIVAVMFENTTLALALLRDLDRAIAAAIRSGSQRCAGGLIACSPRLRQNN